MLRQVKQMIEIREASREDHISFNTIFKPIIALGESYDYTADHLPQVVEEWFNQSYKIYKAILDEKIVGFYKIRANSVGRGSHIANCSYIVDVKASGKGIGRALGMHSIEMCKKFSFEAMQFNRVVSTNTAAVALWKKLGFVIVGQIPNGYQCKDKKFVDVYVMYKSL
jgi:L-amino acid N-acyltransferase YncA